MKIKKAFHPIKLMCDHYQYRMKPKTPGELKKINIYIHIYEKEKRFIKMKVLIKI